MGPRERRDGDSPDDDRWTVQLADNDEALEVHDAEVLVVLALVVRLRRDLLALLVELLDYGKVVLDPLQLLVQVEGRLARQHSGSYPPDNAPHEEYVGRIRLRLEDSLRGPPRQPLGNEF